MTALRIIGALLVLAGLVYMAMAAINRGKLSDPKPNPSDTAGRTLEPRHRGTRFLGIAVNWPGLAMIAAGVLLIVLTWALQPAPPP